MTEIFDPQNLEGLSSQEVLNAQLKFGLNNLKEEIKLSPWKMFFLQLNNPMVYVLLAATVLSFVMGEILNSIAIFIIIILNSIIGFVQEFKAESSINALKKLTVPKARVRRESKVAVIDSSQVVPGDILIIEAGDYVVADAIILKDSQLTAEESILTGESLPVQKISREKFEKINSKENDKDEEKDKKNVLFAGTAINSGSGVAKVIRIGMETELGKIAGLLDKTSKLQTPLQLRMKQVSYKLLIFASIVMFFVFVIGLIKNHPFIYIFMYSISLAVAAIPEGLTTVVTLALALAVRRMTKRNTIIRKLAAVETLGSADVICTDKTGTLTTGVMLVREVFTLEQGISESAIENAEELYLASVLSNNASIDHGGSGDSTEIALLMMAKNHGQNISEMILNSKRVKEWSFDSDRKRMSVLVKRNDQMIFYCKGAPESILPLCHLNKNNLNKIEQVINELTKKGRRLLALSYKMVTSTADESENDLKFIGLLSLADPPKKETFSAIKSCKASGIKVIMITGDHPLTALAIANELGITELGKFDRVMTGKELDEISEEKFQIESEKIAVYARVTSEHKLKIVRALQKNGHIVAMTGDGVNDAPALKQASIGISMGKSGTEVARQASDMILTDDNFSTIVSAVEEGRAVHGNIKRTIQYLLSTNLAELLIVFGSIIFGMPNPLVPLGLLWINIITDGLPSLALSVEPVRENFLEKSLGPSSKNFFDRKFLWELVIVGLLMTTIELVVYQYALITGTESFAKSCAFNLLVYLSLFRSFSCRSDSENYFNLKFNPYHLLAVLLPITLQIALEYNNYFLNLLKISPLHLSDHLILMGISLIPVVLVEIFKSFSVKKRILKNN